MEWFRAYHGAPFDTKLAVVAKRAGKPRGMVAAVWWAVLDCASQAVTRGNAVKLDIEEIAVSFDWESDDILTIVRAMRDKGMIGKDGEIIAWEKRQPKREDNSTERVRRFRETRRNTMKHGNGVEQNRAEKSREEQRRVSDPSGSDSAAGATRYAFSGKIIRLTLADLDQWRKSYNAIPDIRAALTALDDFYDAELIGKDRKDWFRRCSSALGKRHQAALLAQQQAKVSPMAGRAAI